MNLIDAFMALDKLHEANRATLINNIKNAGKRNYSFDKYSDEQLYRMWQNIQKEAEKTAGWHEYAKIINAEQKPICSKCGQRLTDGALCPVCDDGEEDYDYEKLSEWLDATGKSLSNSKASTTTASTAKSQNTLSTTTTANIVTIVYDSVKQKLRARADDGIHGIGYVAFPNALRNKEGQQYEVETLVWNGKNYRVSGNIKPI
jgi:hypothetical protein